ncbi:hypothetical protein [Streptomyces sp. NPDC058665]|uniref:hypothetical protein n=1 Tax=Streptomyces sp. NPDC058665 TaxID=3346586 RepID=UPI003669CA4B
MTAVHEQYATEMRQQFGYLATWLPGTRISVGDVGVLRGSRFEPYTTLAGLRVDFGMRPVGTPGDLEYASAGQVEVEWHGQAGLLAGSMAGAQTRVTVSFKRSHATFFQASRAATSAISDLPAVERALIGLGGDWQREWVVVTEVVKARSAVVVVSSRRGGRLDLRVQGGEPGASLAELASRVQVNSEAGIAARVVSPTGLTPLFRVCQLRGGRVRRVSLVYRGGREQDSPIHAPEPGSRLTEPGESGGHRDGV